MKCDVHFSGNPGDRKINFFLKGFSWAFRPQHHPIVTCNFNLIQTSRELWRAGPCAFRAMPRKKKKSSIARRKPKGWQRALLERNTDTTSKMAPSSSRKAPWASFEGKTLAWAERQKTLACTKETKTPSAVRSRITRVHNSDLSNIAKAAVTFACKNPKTIAHLAATRLITDIQLDEEQSKHVRRVKELENEVARCFSPTANPFPFCVSP